MAIGSDQPTPGTVTSPAARIIGMLASGYVRSVGAQALVSAFHFALNLFLVRNVSPHAYGTFAFAFVIALFAAAINNALISTPLTVYTPVIDDPQARRKQENMFAALNARLFAVLLLLVAVASAALDLPVLLCLGVAAYVAIYAARQYTRNLGYARLRPLVTASGDTTYVVTGMLLLGALVMSPRPLQIGLVLCALALAQLAAMVVELVRLNGFVWPTVHQGSALQRYRSIWLQARWALIGALTTLFMGQAHGVIINASIGPSAFAPLAAGFVLFGPLRVALLTWQNMVKPEMAIALARPPAARLGRQLLTTSAMMLVAVVAMGLLLAVFWPEVHALLYERQYADEPMAYIVGCWCVVTFCSAAYCAPSAALQAMRQFRLLAMASLYGAVVSGILVSVLLVGWSAADTLLGILAAEAFVAAFLIREVSRRLDDLASGAVPG